MFGIKKIEYLTYKDTLYQVYRRIPKGVIKEKHVLDVRDAWHCDIVLRTKNKDEETLIFLVECPDAEIIEEIPFPTPIPTVPDHE